jgi:Rps23 Pro-64 3,4-dihydroxylase Tpa1-like proline 4-hydroxylase
MSMLDLAQFEAAILQREPCDYIVVPHFVKAAALDAINVDYPDIVNAGNFPVEDLSYGPKFGALIEELTGPELRARFEQKFGFDLTSYPTQVTIRKFVSALDGNIHNDSRTKKITVLIYFNHEWHQPGGQLRITRSETDLDDYFVEIPPVQGTLLAFRRNERSFHGFPPAQGERRSLQMYWVEPKRLRRNKPTGMKKTLHKLFRKAIGTR